MRNGTRGTDSPRGDDAGGRFSDRADYAHIRQHISTLASIALTLPRSPEGAVACVSTIIPLVSATGAEHVKPTVWWQCENSDRAVQPIARVAEAGHDVADFIEPLV